MGTFLATGTPFRTESVFISAQWAEGRLPENARLGQRFR
jgi:hypothetical protein